MNIRKIRKIVKALDGWKSYGYKYYPQPTIPEYGKLSTDYTSKFFANTHNNQENAIDTAKLLEYTLNMLGDYSNPNNNSTTNAVNNGIDIGASILQKIPGMGTTVGTVLKIGNSVGGLLRDTGLVKSTDGMTTLDSILDSNIMAFSPLAWANTAFGKNSITVHKDAALQSKQGSEYAGTFLYINNTIDKYGNKSYGAFSAGSRRNANKKLRKARNYLAAVGNINSNSENDNLIAASMSQLRNDSYNSKLLGGISYSKKGGTLDSKIKRVKKRTKPIWKSEIILSWETPERTIEQLIEYAKEKNPRFIQRMSEPLKLLDLGNGEYGTHLMSWATDSDGNAIVYSQIQEDENGNLVDYGDEAIKRALSNNNYLIMTPNEAKLFTESGVDENGNFFGYKKGWEEFFKSKFKQGGTIKKSEELVKLEETNQKNVIPEGALHKNKHHMEDAEGLTKKGIPVVDNEGELQAEIERNEIIFTLEVTKLLEESLEKYNSEESLTKKDKIATEVGKLLVELILYNTDDKTGLIDETT